MILNQSLYKRKLKERGLTQKVLAEAFAENEKTFSAYIKTGNYDESILTKIAVKLGTTVNELWHQSSTDDVPFTNEYYIKYIKLLEKNEAERDANLQTQVYYQRLIQARMVTIFQHFAKHRSKSEGLPLLEIEAEMNKDLDDNLQDILKRDT